MQRLPARGAGGPGEHERRWIIWHARPSRSFAHEGAGEASEASTGVDYGSSIVEKTRSLALVLQQRREEQAPQATLNTRRPTKQVLREGCEPTASSGTKRAAHRTQRQ